MSSKRILVLVDRSMTDKTPKLIWEHEVPLLEEIHGQGTIITIDVEKLDKMPMDHYGIGESFKCADIAMEYDRLATVYGMHDKVELPVVEKVYGSLVEGRFERALGKDCVAKDEFDLRATSEMLVESVEMGMWDPGIKRALWNYEAIMKAAKLKGVWKKDKTLRESIIALMREKVGEEEKEAA